MNGWAEEYQSGRLTGQRVAEPARDNMGDVAPGWRYVGDMDDVAFGSLVEWEEHEHYHRRGQSYWACSWCRRERGALWIEN